MIKDRVIMQEAARKLGIKEEAIRDCTRWGALEHDKVPNGARFYVSLGGTEDWSYDGQDADAFWAVSHDLMTRPRPSPRPPSWRSCETKWALSARRPRRKGRPGAGRAPSPRTSPGPTLLSPLACTSLFPSSLPTRGIWRPQWTSPGTLLEHRSRSRRLLGG